MATWEPKVTTTPVKDPSGLVLNFVIDFYRDGVLYSSVAFNGLNSIEQAKDKAEKQIAVYKRIEEIAALDPATLVGVLDPKTTPIVPQPTPDELDKAEFMTNVRILRGMKSAITLGLMSAGDKRFVDLLALVTPTLKDEYFPFMPSGF